MKEALTVVCGQCNYKENVREYREQLEWLLENDHWHCKKCNSSALYIDFDW